MGRLRRAAPYNPHWRRETGVLRHPARCDAPTADF